jgi:hypothetical protein
MRRALLALIVVGGCRHPEPAPIATSVPSAGSTTEATAAVPEASAAREASAAAAARDAPVAPPAAEPPLPAFNQRVLALIASYPERGFGGYAWPSTADGTSRDLRLGREVIARAAPGNHCVGMTFEVFWRALEECAGGAAAVLTAPAARRLRLRWYVPDPKGTGPAEALPAFGLGAAIPLDQARPGDFVQAWNTDGTFGHSMVFLGWERDDDGRIRKIRYWSSQPWTGGIGVSDMEIGEAGFDLAHVHVARAACPER